LNEIVEVEAECFRLHIALLCGVPNFVTVNEATMSGRDRTRLDSFLIILNHLLIFHIFFNRLVPTGTIREWPMCPGLTYVRTQELPCSIGRTLWPQLGHPSDPRDAPTGPFMAALISVVIGATGSSVRTARTGV